jgi:hypothetical protein
MPIDVPIDVPIDGMCNTSAASLVNIDAPIDAPIDVDSLWHQEQISPNNHGIPSRKPIW